MNRKAVAPIVVVLIILAILILFYLILFLPIPQFKSVRYSINYWGILVLFFSVQAGIIYLYYKLIQLGTKGFSDIKNNAIRLTDRVKSYIKLKMKL